jgi:heme/copper-type cytochrome/quinol oxidase subunit 4
VIEQARTPLAPVAPKRTLIAAGGAFVALGAGFALALLLEILSSAIRTGADLERTVKLRPIVVVPYIYTPAEKQKRWFLQVATVLVFIVVLPGSIWLVDQYVKPIEQVSDDIMKKTGLEKMWRTIKPRLM